MKIEFVKKDVLKIAPHGDSEIIAIVCDYTLTKEGLVNAKITGFEGKQEFKDKLATILPVGLDFTFKWTMKGDAAKLGDVKGDKVETLKSHLEGEFEKKS